MSAPEALATELTIQAVRPIPTHGGELIELLASPLRAAELQAASRDWISWELTPRQLCDLELLLNGGFSPLRGFLARADYESVCATMRLADGLLWPIPVTLDVTEEIARQVGPGISIALRDPEGVLLAALHVEQVWQPDRIAEAEAVYGTTSREHPGAAYVLEKTHPWYAGGRVEGIRLPVHHDSRALRLGPAELREEFAHLSWQRIVAFQTRNPMHRAHVELTRRAADQADAKVLIHPVVGMTKFGDVDHYTRVRCYQAILTHYPADTAKLALLPLAMRMAGPREALWHALLRRNYGCTHFIVGRDHASPGAAGNGKPFYEPYAAQDLLRKHQAELGVRMIPFRKMVYLAERDRYVPDDEVPRGARPLAISGTELRRRLTEGRDVPGWFTFPEVALELRRIYRKRSRQGLTIFLTGLSGAGKSTIANVLLVKFLEAGGRPVTLLDGDLVRKQLSSDLAFSEEDRNRNILRIGFVAAEITRNGGITICAPIAPYDHSRKEVRAMIEPWGGFVLVHVATPLEVCEQRDRKGLYARARAGLLPHFTGISDPYEEPSDAELVIDTQVKTPEQAADRILDYLRQERYLSTRKAPVGRAPRSRVMAHR